MTVDKIGFKKDVDIDKLNILEEFIGDKYLFRPGCLD